LDMGAGTKLQGARGAAAMMYLEEEFLEKSRAVWQAIEKNWTHSLGRDIPGQSSAWQVDEIVERVPWGTYRTLIRCAYLLKELYEHLRRVGDPEDREKLNLKELSRLRARTALSICACEQASLDQGSWDLAWRFTHLPEPPFHKLSKVTGEKANLVHATGLDKRYLAAGLAVLRDEGVILDRRKQEAKGRRPAADGAKADGEGAPQKGGGKGK